MASNNATSATDQDEDLLPSEISLWLPRTVVKRHRKKATIIWVSLLIAFFAYISFIVWDTVQSRRDPASSFQIKREIYPFPDLAVCLTRYEGCLASNLPDCLVSSAFSMTGQSGFLNETLDIDEASLALEAAFPTCKVLPASKLMVNMTGIENGDITNFYAKFALFWIEDPNDEYDPTLEGAQQIYTRFVNLFFLDVDKGVEVGGEEVVDAKLPYDLLLPTPGETMFATINHMVLSLRESVAISTSSGRKGEPELSYSQASTSGTQVWYWNTSASSTPIATLLFDLSIPKFEFTKIEEVDPVDAWAIIGAIGGVWQFVVIAFGLFFVFSEKQPPDKKMRNFRKTIAKPASVITKRLSSTSSKGSTSEDVVVDASDEDLPVEWVKRQRKDGHFYYCNAMTGVVRDNSPNDGDAVTAAPPRRTIASVFKPAQRAGAANDFSTGKGNGSNLPPGWIQREDGNGKTYYINTVLKTTQWELPVQRTPDGASVQVVDAPMAHSRRSSESSYRSSMVVGNSDSSRVAAAASDVAHAALPSPPPPRSLRSPAAPAGSPPPPASLPAALSYRTAMSLLSSSDGTRGVEPSSAPATSFPPLSGSAEEHASTVSGGGGRGRGDSGVAAATLPPGWERRTTAEGRTYYAHSGTKTTQWHAPPM